MPRRSRIILPGIPLHIIQRGNNNRQACFYADEDYLADLDWLAEYARSSHCAVHPYVLMTNHVHLLVRSETNSGAGELMKRLGQRCVQYIDRTYRRSGTLWERDKPKIFGPLIVLVISFVESNCCLQPIVERTAQGSCHPKIHEAGWCCTPPAID